jgi:hypothetical protein
MEHCSGVSRAIVWTILGLCLIASTSQGKAYLIDNDVENPTEPKKSEVNYGEDRAFFIGPPEDSLDRTEGVQTKDESSGGALSKDIEENNKTKKQHGNSTVVFHGKAEETSGDSIELEQYGRPGLATRTDSDVAAGKKRSKRAVLGTISSVLGIISSLIYIYKAGTGRIQVSENPTAEVMRKLAEMQSSLDEVYIKLGQLYSISQEILHKLKNNHQWTRAVAAFEKDIQRVRHFALLMKSLKKDT